MVHRSVAGPGAASPRPSALRRHPVLAGRGTAPAGSPVPLLRLQRHPRRRRSGTVRVESVAVLSGAELGSSAGERAAVLLARDRRGGVRLVVAEVSPVLRP